MSGSIFLTVFFDDPFWVGVFERADGERLLVCKTVFGAEPRDREVYLLILQNFYKMNFGGLTKADIRKKAENPKRRFRDAKKQLGNNGIGTRSQQALKKQQEEQKTERRQLSRKRHEEEEKRRFDLKQEKRKKKHRGH